MPAPAAALLRLNPWPALRRRASARAAAWVRRRQGEDQLPIRLERRRLYILPTRAGLAFGALVFVMLLAGLNYANSLALFLTFTLAALALVAMQLCHHNLLGLEVQALGSEAVFAQQPGALRVALANPHRAPRYRLQAAVEQAPGAAVDLAGDARAIIEAPLAPQARGVRHVSRVRLETRHPFGLFRAWTWVHLPVEWVVYPQPAGQLPMPEELGRRSGERVGGGAGFDEWLGLRPFREGDSPRQVDWKAYAREAPLLVKEYQPSGAELRLFDFTRVPLPGTEARLSQLARWVVEAEARGERYALRLPQAALAAEHGPQHRHGCLKLLAAFAPPAGPAA